VKALVLLALAVLFAAAPARAGALERGVAYLEARQQEDGGFAEPGGPTAPGLTAWAVLGLAAAGRPPAAAAAYLANKPYPAATDLALRILALEALSLDTSRLARQLEGLRRPDGSIGLLVNSTIWGVISLRAAGRPVDPATVRFLSAAQGVDGGWSWRLGVAPDADDTAGAIQALRSAGIAAGTKTIRRGLAFLRRLQNSDGGFELEEGKGSNAQSTSWAIQAFLAAERDAGAQARSYLLRLQRPDGSFRYSARYATTPVWVTSYAVAALAGRPFPFA
jgi:Squalene-hopene cyclase C-terminal domain/Prenyltransferase and squalene oxidase repeat